MGKSRSSISKAKNSETDDSFGDLRLAPLERDKLVEFMPLFDKFIAALPTKSGTSLHIHFLEFLIYFRSIDSMFFWYSEEMLQEIFEVLLRTNTTTAR